MCKQEFVTTRRDKIWCSTDCSSKFREVKKSIDINYDKQKLMSNKAFIYDISLNKFFLKSLL